MTQLVVSLALLVGLCAVAVLLRRAWLAGVAMVAATVLGLVLLYVAAARPLPAPPPPKFVLWYWTGQYSWLSDTPDNAPKTYAWMPPPEMRAALERGGPLSVEKQEGERAMRGTRDTDFEGEWRFTPLEIIGVEK